MNKKYPALLLISILAATIFAGGCGLQIEETNKALSKAAGNQQESEQILARLKAFPQEWEALFNVPQVGAEQVSQARQIIEARRTDIEALEDSLKIWKKELKKILSLNVDQKVKDYVQMKVDSIDSWSTYVSGNLRPIIEAYSGIVELIAYGRPLTEQEAAALELANLVTESRVQLEECEEKSKKADDFFKENELGN